MGLIRLDPTVEDEAKRDRAISIFLLLQKKKGRECVRKI
jgi:hypothetical protein